MQNNQIKRPFFIGIGAQKAGTTWLYQKLHRHPQIWVPPEKELHFFDRSPHYPSPNQLATSSPWTRLIGKQPWEMDRTIKLSAQLIYRIMRRKIKTTFWYCQWTFGYYDDNWYVDLFSQAQTDQIMGEITPSYSILENEDIAHLSAINPDIKLIFMLRNPIDRAWSAVRFYNDKNPTKQVNSSDEMVSLLKTPDMVLRGDYERTLNNYLNHFDSSQILMGFYDAIIADPSGLLSGIANFLEVAPFQDKVLSNKTRVNQSSPLPMPGEVKDYLWETYTPMIERLAKNLGSYATTWQNSESGDTPKFLSPYTHSKPLPVVHP